MIEVKTTTYCDRCGKELEESESIYAVLFYVKPNLFCITEKSFATTHIDLCFDCAKSFNEWKTQYIKERYES